ncbi:MAG: urate hydroxylase PuuD [Robiginitomaculum sp.]|nr:urate hydroxylase PuuD [Robiginitomaculum sp.]
MGIDLYAWLSLILRWLHVITGIAWIGASFYFVWLDNNLERPEKVKKGEPDGELWSVHGGGFYHNKKYMSAPDNMPEHLHWFKYEAYFTWMSGFALMAVIYYYGANLYLIDKSKMALSQWQAIGASMGMLAGGWIVYDLMCKSPLRKRPGLFAIVLFLLFTCAAILAGKTFSDRAAYMQIGAMIGTIMAGNVFFNIIPNQKIVVADLIAGRPVNPEFGKAAKLRSMHNNYMTLPVLFIMTSAHYPMTYGSGIGWLSLALIALAGIAVRHVFNIRAKGKPVTVFVIAAVVFMVAAMTFPLALKKPAAQDVGAVSFSDVRKIMETHCTACHAPNPSHEWYDEPPNGFRLDTDELIKQNKALIMERTVTGKDMPLGNETNMTDAEREMLRIWIIDK